MAPETAMGYLQATPNGLSQDEAATRLRLKGANLLSVKKPPTWWQLLLSVIPNPFNVLLGLLAVISAATPPPQWSTFILLILMIVISCGVRFWQEYRSSVAAIKLQAGVSTDVRVRRRINGLQAEEIFVDEKTLVPGDILLVDPGTVIPADCMILKSTNLQISQSRYGISS
jgi:Mg2+-importing ATPase